MNTRKKHNSSKEELEYRQSRLLYSEESTSLVKSQSRLFIQEQCSLGKCKKALVAFTNGRICINKKYVKNANHYRKRMNRLCSFTYLKKKWNTKLCTPSTYLQ